MENFKRFTPTKKVFLYFYSKTDNKFKYLFIRNFVTPKKFSVIHTDVSSKDNHPLFSLARILTNSFYKLFLYLPKILNNEITDISSFFLKKNKPLSHTQLWS